MHPKNIKEIVIRVLREQAGVKEISLEATPISLGLDSLDIVEIVMALEDEIKGLELEGSEEVFLRSTVQQIIDRIVSILEEKS